MRAAPSPLRTTFRLAAIARRLNGGRGLPRLWLFTDPARIADPVAAVTSLPRGSGVVYRHFGAADRAAMGQLLAKACRRYGHTLLIGADAALAGRLGAGGVHLPERMTRRRPLRVPGLVTAAAHSRRAAARAAGLGVGLVFLSAVFDSDSPSAGKAIGVLRASAMARALPLGVVALGGLTHTNAARLIGRGFAGLAGVSALSGGQNRKAD